MEINYHIVKKLIKKERLEQKDRNFLFPILFGRVEGVAYNQIGDITSLFKDAYCIPIERIFVIGKYKGIEYYDYSFVGGSVERPIIYNKVEVDGLWFYIGFYAVDLVKAFITYPYKKGTEFPKIFSTCYSNAVRTLYPSFSKRLDEHGRRYDKSVFKQKPLRFWQCRKNVEDEFFHILCYFLCRMNGERYTLKYVKESLMKNINWTEFFN